MGLFSRKKKGTPSPRTPSLPSFSPIIPSTPSSPVPPSPVVHAKPQSTLRVALDPAPVDHANALFTITLDQDSDIQAVRTAIAAQIGLASFSLFKVIIPTLAHSQAVEYQTRYSVPVNLLTSFPSFDLDDPRQLQSSLGLAWRPGTPSDSQSNLRVIDWFPEGAQTDIISILVRTSESSSCLMPTTFVTHFAPLEPFSSSSRFNLARQTPAAPTVVTVDPQQSIRELKTAILRADRREVKTELLERVVLWRVEMSEEEMIVIGERGGLKNGRMPWPYPPGALVPVALSEDDNSVEHYFPTATSTPRMVTISVWLDSRACLEMPRPSISAGPVSAFKYPMTFDEPQVEKSSTPRRSRQRPSTAPAVVVSASDDSTPAPPAFGFKSHSSIRAARTPSPSGMPSRPRVASPLSTISMPSTVQRGLGINVPEDSLQASSTPLTSSPTTITRSNTIPRGSISASDCSSSDEATLPSLSFSQLSLMMEPSRSVPSTPDGAEKHFFDWPTVDAGSNHVKAFGSLRSKMSTIPGSSKFVF